MPISTSNGLTSPNCRPFSFLEGSEKQVPETVQDTTDAVRGCAGLFALLQPAHIGEHLHIRTRVALKHNWLPMYLEADGSHGDSSRQWRTRDRIGEPSRLMTCSPGFLPADDAQPLETARVARKEREDYGEHNFQKGRWRCCCAFTSLNSVTHPRRSYLGFVKL